MSSRISVMGQVTAVKSASAVNGALLQRQCACGQHALGGQCQGCKQNQMTLRRKSHNENVSDFVPPIVHEVLRSPGQPLDSATRAFFEPRFGHDFSRVRVHTDDRAAESAESVSALAYTVGRDIVFGAGQFAPSTSAGRKLLAHELTHVGQQNFQDTAGQVVAEIGSTDDAYEREADRMTGVIAESNAGLRGPILSLDSPSVRSLAVQRQVLNCSTTAVRDECNNATAKCATAADHCKDKFPTAADLDNYIANLKSNFASSDFGPNAKRNFGHWLDATGSDLVMPATLFVGHSATKDALSTHRAKFLAGVQKRIADGRIKPGALSDVIFYTGHGNAYHLSSPHSDDLAYAVGGFQLCSNVRVMVASLGSDRYKVQFTEWKCEAFDCYNWDPGKGIGIGDLDDSTLCCVENAKKAKHFFDRTDVWDNKDPDSTADAEVTVSSSGTGSGSTAKDKKEEKGR